MPTLKESSSPEGHILGSSLQDKAAPAQQCTSQLSSAPIVLSRQNSSSSEEGAASEPEAAAELSVSSEEDNSGGGSAQTTVRAPEQTHSKSGDFTDPRRQSDSFQLRSMLAGACSLICC